MPRPYNHPNTKPHVSSSIAPSTLKRPLPVPAVAPPPPPPPRAVTLRQLNGLAALVHLAIATTVLAAGNRSLTIQLFVTNVVTLNREEGDWILHPNGVDMAGRVSLIGLIAAFELITAFAHLGNAALWPVYYQQCIDRCVSPLRWGEYAITAPIMLSILAIFAGHVGLYEHILLFALTSMTMAFGLFAEALIPTLECPTPRLSRWTAHFLGYAPLTVVWAVLTAQFVRYAQAEGLDPQGVMLNKMPEWVYALFILELLLFWSFAFVQWWVMESPNDRYERGERLFVILSFASKATLSFIVFGGTMNLVRDNIP